MSVILSKIKDQTGEAIFRLRCLGNSSRDETKIGLMLSLFSTVQFRFLNAE